MEEPARIIATPPTMKSQDYAFLREEAMGLIRQSAGLTWTDHNLHDPGITLLEALCYAITELGLRTGMDMRDLLTSSEQFAPQEFFTASQVLPSAPLTALDFRKVLIDHPLLRNAWVSILEPVPHGRSSALLEFSEEDLNSSTFTIIVNPPVLGTDYQVDVAFPFWDEPEVMALRTDVQLLSVAFDGPPGDPWRLIEGGEARFARAALTYQPAVGGPEVLNAWIIAQVNTPMDNPLVELPEILDEVATAIATLGDNSPADQTLFKQYNRRVTAAFEATRVVRRYLRDYRNLCEDFVDFRAVRLQEVAFSATIEIGSGVDVEQLLANIFYTVDAFISPPIVFNSLVQLQEAGADTATIFEGPLLDNGFLQDESVNTSRPVNTIYASDIFRLIFQLRNAAGTDVEARENTTNRSIIAIRNFGLSNYLDNRNITSEAKDCLQLVNSNRHIPRLSPSKCHIVFYRNGVEVAYDLSRAMAIFVDKKNAAAVSAEPGSEDIPIPKGDAYAISDYYPVQNDLPIFYGVGEAGLPPHVTEERIAQARQLGGYLFFYEQVLAGYLSQLAHINAFFSADPTLTNTLFQQPLYHLSRVADILRNFDPSVSTWEDFQNDLSNPYAATLQMAVESQDQFISRRNRTLDHLLARLGEDMNAYAAQLYQTAAQVPGASSLPLPDLLTTQQQRRRAAAQHLIQDKSSFYYDLPAINAAHNQAIGNLAWRMPEVYEIQQTPAGFSWQIQNFEGNLVLQQAAPAISMAEALRHIATSLALATSADRYAIVIESGGQRRLELRPAPTEDPIAVSINTFGTNPQAQAAILAISSSIRQSWVENDLTPLECRLYHELGIPLKQRRQLLVPTTTFFEIFDEPDADPFIEKLYRLWSEPGATGDALLVSSFNYPGPDDPTATAAAEQGIALAIQRGVLPENYSVEEPAPGDFIAVLHAEDGSALAQSPAPFASREEAQASARAIQQLLYRQYSAEGFYLIEHLLLFPQGDTDIALDLQGESSDPYSFQISFILPSGFARDFSVPEGARTPVQPDRFRGEEFRRYAEQTIRKACPAHILPCIVWVDTAAPGTAPTGDEPCFDWLEFHYRAWLEAWITDEIDEGTIGPLRNNLTTVINAIYLDQSN